MKLTITGYSTALFSTWYFVDELGLLLDAGDGVTSALLQKSRKIHHAFISHADRDHLTGLLQFNQLNAREGAPVIYYPADSGSFPALKTFAEKFDPHVSGTVWIPVTERDRIRIKDDIYVMPLKNGHVPVSGGNTKSLSYKVMQVRKKLKPEFSRLGEAEIKQLVSENGRDALTHEVDVNILGYSGDTPVEDLHRWDKCEILIHEATFLGGEEDNAVQYHGNRHSKLEEVMEMVSGSDIGTLILGHFSSRYSQEQIDRKILQLCEKYALKTIVHRILPGEVVSGVLSRRPLYGR